MSIHDIQVRDETPEDYHDITEITIKAFALLAVSHQTEQFIIQALRSAGDLTLSLVAEAGGQVVGHIAFSPVSVSDGTEGWYGLGPVSVHPDVQKQGIGKALITEGLSRLKALNARGCCLVGHPEYYGRFGFKNDVETLVYEKAPSNVFFVLPFGGNDIPQGTVAFHEAFEADS